MPCPLRFTLASLLLALPATPALAYEVCDLPPRYGLSELAIRIARIACDENRQWYRPFIGLDGRLASQRVTEAESAELLDHGVPAWRRVVDYWQGSGTLAMLDRPGAASCRSALDERSAQSDCRAFVLDTPWSAAFVSWVMVQAGVPGFHVSPSHIDYIAASYRGRNGPYAYVDPAIGKPEPGDLLCYLRGNRQAYGPAGLKAALAAGGDLPRKSHCDIVVAANVGGDRTLYLIGGNVLNAVTLRKLPLDATGHAIPPTLPVSDTGGEDTDDPGTYCSPGNETACNFNRQDWAVLLKLQVAASAEPAATSQ